MMKKWYFLFLLGFLLTGCRESAEPDKAVPAPIQKTWMPRYARGFTVAYSQDGLVYLTVKNPWPGSEKDFRYALVPREKIAEFTPPKEGLDGVIGTPVKRIILTRPAVEAGERLGFLPGDMKEKVDPYMQPLYDALNDFLPGKQVAKLIEEKRAEFEAAQQQTDAFAKSEYPEGAQLCSKCNTVAVIMMDGCMTCLSCGDSKCG